MSRQTHAAEIMTLSEVALIKRTRMENKKKHCKWHLVIQWYIVSYYNNSNREMGLLLLFVFFQCSFLKLLPLPPLSSILSPGWRKIYRRELNPNEINRLIVVLWELNMKRTYCEGFEQRMDNKSIVISIQGLILR